MTSPEAVTISNCTFCGGAVKPTHRMIVNCDSYWEICCNEEGHSALVVADTEVDALAKWNARAAPRPTDADCQAAEHAYATTAFDFERDPIGSERWVQFWNGWQARMRTPTAPTDAENIEDVDCPNCDGSGCVVGITSGCCNQPNDSGDCCGCPIQLQCQEQCEYCRATGKIAVIRPAVSDDARKAALDAVNANIQYMRDELPHLENPEVSLYATDGLRLTHLETIRRALSAPAREGSNG